MRGLSKLPVVSMIGSDHVEIELRRDVQTSGPPREAPHWRDMLQIRLEKEGIGKEKSGRVPPRPRQERPRQKPRRGPHDRRRPNVAPCRESRQICVEPPLAKVGEDCVARRALGPRPDASQERSERRRRGLASDHRSVGDQDPRQSCVRHRPDADGRRPPRAARRRRELDRHDARRPRRRLLDDALHDAGVCVDRADDRRPHGLGERDPHDERVRDATAKSRPVASSPSPSPRLGDLRRSTDPGRDGRPRSARGAAARARQARDVFERRAIGHDSRDYCRSAEDVAGRPSLLHWLVDIHLHVRRLGLRGSRSFTGRARRRRL